ncbi:uncharacterized protein BX663DRAFT_500763 [Cokeromyces recurvatus]|uniref:uncharacterized protein n=1 Tax=Cokeromyces recurvatus TaxID=90255 RepID=UPI00222110C7|nr:uncharacterized protein BX663DRAFT_500763 [Cokeromyces recurvatus]KAI7905745.1 hypothetical protein BX663DRAFT_500763 [Cokeromyces recurvatus]
MNFELDTLSYALITSIIGAAALLSVRNSKSPDIHPLLLNTQSDVSRLRHPEESAVYRSRMYPMGTPLCSTFDRAIRTMADFYKAGGLEKNTNSDFLYQQSGGYLDYGTVGKKIKPIYQGLRIIAGLEPQTQNENSFVGIYAKNSQYTVLTEIACHCNGLVTIPISSYASSSHLSYIIQKTALKVLIAESDLVDHILSLAQDTSLKQVVVLGEISDINQEKANQIGIQLFSFDEMEAKGKSAVFDTITVVPNDFATIYFSSSALKESKNGVILTHKNLLSSISSYLLVIPPQQRFSSKDRLLLNLPIDNVFRYVLTAAVSLLGGSIAFNEQETDDENIDVGTYLTHIATVKPTIFVSGPIFLRQVKHLIESRYNKSFLFKRGYSVKKEYLEEGRLVNDCKYDMLVFRDIRQKMFGGNLRLIYIDNDDNMDPSLATFLRIILSTQVLQTFNLTETVSSITASMFYDYNADPKATGAPLPCNEIKLVDVKELSLTAEDQPNPRGEIWVRGNNVFAGYYNNSSATTDVLDTDGWYTTGYLGEILPNGTLKVIGKK